MLIEVINKPGLVAIPKGRQHASARQVWAERRRVMEVQKAHFGPDGARSLWRSRIFSVGLEVFHRGARLVRLPERGRSHALDI